MTARRLLPWLVVCLVVVWVGVALAVRANMPQTSRLLVMIGATPSSEAPAGGKPERSIARSTPLAPIGTPGDVVRPDEGRWIDVDVARYQVQLMDGDAVVQTIAPVAVGANIDTGEYESTQTGLFHVYNMIADLQYDAPYDAYISDWVGFDPDRDNGFHSFLLNAEGQVIDDATGSVSNGCIRTAEAAAIFDFAEIGMPVLVHA